MVSRLRLISGLVLFFFVLTHFVNHIFGIVSLSAMDAGLFKTVVLWRTPVGTLILATALAVHVVLTLHALYTRRSLKLTTSDFIQFASGLLIPVLIAAHVASTRGAYHAFGLEEGYKLQLYGQWVLNPVDGILAVSALIVVWVHGCIGWHNWLKFTRWYQRFQTLAFSLAILIPTLALAGIVSGTYRVLRLSRSEKWVDRVTGKAFQVGGELQAFIDNNEFYARGTVVLIVALLLGTYLMRRVTSVLPGGERMQYVSAAISEPQQIKLRKGTTVLDLLREAGIEHASVCGGRGRCSTCRVKVDAKGQDLPEPSADEQRVLNRIGSIADVRLACQLKPAKSLSVTALLTPESVARGSASGGKTEAGDEQEIAVLFADIRSFTSLSEAQLPFDTAFMLNRYFAAMGQAIEGAGGHLDKFIGDGVMALFGIDDTPENGSRKALAAAKSMSERLVTLNESLANDIGEPIRIGIGIHCGNAIVGRMGYGHATGLTAIGDVVNTASRLEGMTKEHGVQLIVSEKTIEKTGWQQPEAEIQEVKVRGRDESLSIAMFGSAEQLVIPK